MVGKFINIASRVQKFLKSNGNRIGSELDEKIVDSFRNETSAIFSDYVTLDIQMPLKKL